MLSVAAKLYIQTLESGEYADLKLQMLQNLSKSISDVSRDLKSGRQNSKKFRQEAIKFKNNEFISGVSKTRRISIVKQLIEYRMLIKTFKAVKVFYRRNGLRT